MQLVEPVEDGPQVTPEERQAVIGRLLVRMSGGRALVVVLDEAQHAADSTRWLRALVSSRARLPVVVVLTMPPGATDSQARMRQHELLELVEALEHDGRAAQIRLGPVPEEQLSRMLGAMLNLSAAVSTKVCRRAEGNPQFALQVVGEWVARGCMTSGPDGFQVPQTELDALPRSLHGIWMGRLHRAVEVGSENLDSIELAATLGVRVVETEWLAACARAGIEPALETVAELHRRALLIPEPDGWRFCHPLLTEALLASATTRQRWHAAAADALADLGEEDADRLRRLARHLVDAGRPAEAWEPARRASQLLVHLGEYEAAAAISHLVSESLAGDEHVETRLLARIQEARVLGRMRQFAPARAILEEVRTEISDEHSRAQAQLALETGVLYRFLAGKLDESERAFTLARDRFTALGDPHGYTDAVRGLGLVQFNRGNLTGAISTLSEALALLARHSRPGVLAMSLVSLGWVHVAAGHPAPARRALERGLALATEQGLRYVIGDARNGLGELHRYAGDLEEAVAQYTEALRVHAAVGSVEIPIVQMNLGMVHLLRREFAPARKLFETVRIAYEEAGGALWMAGVYLGLLAAAAGGGAWDEFDDALQRARATLESSTSVYEDFVISARIARDEAQLAGQTDRAALAESLRAHTERRLGSGASQNDGDP